MMNQGGTTEPVAPAETYSLENQHVVDASQGQTSSYIPQTTGPDAISWTIPRADHSSTQNGILASSTGTYQYDYHTEPPTRNAQDGLNVAPLPSSSSSLGTSNVSQDYNGYASYPNSTDPYGYGSAGYPNYYNSYQQQQQQSNHSSYPQQQQSNHSSYQQQQSNHSSYQQQQSNHSGYQQQQQSNHSGYQQQQSNHSYSQPVGAYQNTGVPYQPLSSFQNTGSYAGPASYSSTYYNPGDYQTAGGYPSGSYSNQTTSWSDGNYTNYTTHQYTNYTPESAGAYSSSTAPEPSLHYQQQYKQWADYYSQTEVSCAPGTENISSTNKSHVACPIPGVSGGYQTSNSQTPPSYTPSWRPDSGSSAFPSVQPTAGISGANDVYWQHGAPSSQVHHTSPMQTQSQKPLDSRTYDSFQDQQKAVYSQGPNVHYHATQQVPQSYQLPIQTVPPLDTRRVSKLQIPTNPRIASNLTFSLPKTDKDSFTTSASAKPAYVSVSLPTTNQKVMCNDAADSILKTGMFPKSLRGYVERALARCKDDTQMAACQAVMKEMITKATADGTLYTLDWDIEPLFPLPNADAADKDFQCSTPGAALPKHKRSPNRRPKSRWEPLPEEKLLDKTASMVTDTVKYGGWMNANERDRKRFVANNENKENNLSATRYSPLDQKNASKNMQRLVKKQRLADGFKAADNGDASSDSDKEQSLTAYYSSAIVLANTPEERKRRENRSKRFEKRQGQAENRHFKPKNAGGGNLYGRRASALVLSKSFEDGGTRAVEDIDWDSLTVKGTCQEIEKRYLRLTSAPDPTSVRPEEVLEKALDMVQKSEKNYLYKCDQLKSIRQDLTVQHIRNQLTVKVYETHARLALEVGDLPEYNQCQSQLKTLYAEGIKGCHMEFSAYNLLGVILHSNNYRDLLSSMSRLSVEAKEDEAVKHALAVRAAVTSGNYVLFFRLYKTAPNLNTCLMDLYVEKMRYKAVSCMSRSYRPTIPVSYITQVLGFTTPKNEECDEDSYGLEECVAWLKAHGACLIPDNSGEMLLDTKASCSSLYMPEPEDAVAHGDASLAVNDFLTRTSL
ncbi:SAC3 family protein A-like isoform X2 [Juglans microcarpa x Juglans regia]|uniref:SAC3 family protein A-like isoform X2 n=1 Tax=Juglans microcarpa x Juglans regia TaxID=2249226 RepID=UPI001B7E92A1|nr:SAC3 family protein A-like isoform X2 [Juglans microcarpa x Juglans regia]